MQRLGTNTEQKIKGQLLSQLLLENGVCKCKKSHNAVFISTFIYINIKT